MILSVLVVIAVVLCLPEPGYSQSRAALFVGSNRSPSGLIPLRYAHQDAAKMFEVFVELGGLSADRAVLLLDPGPEELRAALADLRAQASSGEADQLLFYYSGHSDKSGLLLGKETMPLAEVQDFLADQHALVRLALLDSCNSGSMSRVKGGKVRPGVDVRFTANPAVKGAVLITSSSAEEASVERDDIGGSLFSHFFASGLRGAADLDEDAKVTLEEAFNYAHAHTLARSTESRAGVQHPTYEYRIAGQRQLVLTWLNRTSYMTFGKALAGTYIVFDRVRNQVVAELSKEPGSVRRLWLPPGDYYIKKRMASFVLLQKVELSDSAEHVVRDHEMHTVPYEEDVTKGHFSEAFRATWGDGAPYLRNTANTLRRGEQSVGLITASLGLTDDIMLSTWPALDALLIPNLHTKLRLVRTNSLVWSVHSGFLQGFIGRLVDHDDRSTTELEAGSSLSWLVSRSLTLTLLGTWVMDSRPDHDRSGAEWESQYLRPGLSATWLVTEHNLIQVLAEAKYTFIAPSGTDFVGNLGWGGAVMYAYAWDIFRLGGGLARDSFISDNLRLVSEFHPMLDLWWRW